MHGLPTDPGLEATLAGLGVSPPGVLVEQPRWSMVKRRSDGRVDFVSPLPCPYNYGCIPDRVAGDGDPLDALVLGARRPQGSRVTVPVVAVVDFLDGGRLDPKVVCAAGPFTAADRAGVLAFFRVYAVFKQALAAVRGQSTVTRVRGFVPPAVWSAPVP